MHIWIIISAIIENNLRSSVRKKEDEDEEKTTGMMSQNEILDSVHVNLCCSRIRSTNKYIYIYLNNNKINENNSFFFYVHSYWLDICKCQITN